MENSIPLVSVGLPVFNGENFVAEAIRCMLAQTFTDWELVISDNCSTDSTWRICNEFAATDRRIRLHRFQRNMGLTPNYNRVVELSRGKYFKWITHDDLFGPQFIESCLQALLNDSKTVLAFPKLVYVDSEGRRLRDQVSHLSITDATPESRVSRLMMLERESTDIFWSQFGLIPTDILKGTRLMGPYGGSDQVLLLELALHGYFKQVEGATFGRREHPAASTVRNDWTDKAAAAFVYADDRRSIIFPYCRMLKEHLAIIRDSSLSAAGKMQCAASILRRFATQWKYFFHEITKSPRQLWRRG
jgi:glycosyltransferase involved in cell wall biosynthesis